MSRLVLVLFCCLPCVVLAQDVVIGAGFDPDGGGGMVLEYHKGGEFSGELENWPWASAIRVDADSDLWMGAGVHTQFDLSGQLFIEASFMPGYYNPEDTDLGGNIHFRSLAGLGFRFGSDSALSISIDHLSNGGLTSSNPGSELVSVRYSYTY